jgi:DNA-directed RNA polymerase specialized sigma24 family protein
VIEDPFVAHRSLLFTVAYEMLGSAADAEDVVQESWLRWADVDQSQVREPRVYLIRVVTRQALNRLRTLSRRRKEAMRDPHAVSQLERLQSWPTPTSIVDG